MEHGGKRVEDLEEERLEEYEPTVELAAEDLEKIAAGILAVKVWSMGGGQTE